MLKVAGIGFGFFALSFGALAGNDLIVETLPPYQQSAVLRSVKIRINKELYDKNEKSFEKIISKPKPPYADNRAFLVDPLSPYFLEQKDAIIIKGEAGAKRYPFIVTHSISDCIAVVVWNKATATSAVAHVDIQTDLDSLSQVMSHFQSDPEHTEITLFTTYRSILLWKTYNWLEKAGFSISFTDSIPVYFAMSENADRITRIYEPEQFGSPTTEELEKLTLPELKDRYKRRFVETSGVVLDTRTGQLLQGFDDPTIWSKFLEGLESKLLSPETDLSQHTRNWYFKRNIGKNGKLKPAIVPAEK